MSYPPTATCQNRTQPTIDAPVVAKQPISQRVMGMSPVIVYTRAPRWYFNLDIRNAGSKESIQEKQQDEEVMRLRGGCPGRFCGLRKSSLERTFYQKWSWRSIDTQLFSHAGKRWLVLFHSNKCRSSPYIVGVTSVSSLSRAVRHQP